jgi:cytochrome P450
MSLTSTGRQRLGQLAVGRDWCQNKRKGQTLAFSGTCKGLLGLAQMHCTRADPWLDRPLRPAAPEPVTGDMHPLILFARFVRNPLEVWAESQFIERRHTFRHFGIEATLLNDPRDIHDVFVRRASHLRHETIRQRKTRSLLGDGVLTAEGTNWQNGRALFAQAFASGSARAPGTAIDRVVTDHLEARLGAGRRVDGSAFTGELTLAIMSAIMFSGDLDPHLDIVAAATDGYFRTCGRTTLGDVFGVPDWVPGFSRAAGNRYKRRLRGVARSAIARRRTSIAAGEDQPADGLAAFVTEADRAGLSEELLEDNVLTLMITGYETVARSLTWALFLLARSQQAQSRARAEIVAAEVDCSDAALWLSRVPFLTACYSEALRLYPPAPLLPRQLRADIMLDGQRLRTGSVVFINTWILHRHRLLWVDPWSFRPERFLPPDSSSIPKHAFLPFGIGQRVCIGARHATLQAIKTIARILSLYEVAYTGQRDPMPILNFTLRPDNGVPLSFTKLGHTI